MSFEFVEAPAAVRGEVASYLVALAREAGLSPAVIRKAAQNGVIGYLVPSELLDAEKGYGPEAPVIESKAPKEAPEDWDEPARPVDIETREDGGVYVKAEAAERVLAAPRVEVDREVIRAWLEANGYEPAEKGALKKAHVAAYYEHNEA